MTIALHLCIILTFWIQSLFMGQLRAGEIAQDARGVKVVFPPGMEGAAREVASLFPPTKKEVEEFLGWKLGKRLTIVIDKVRRKNAPDPFTGMVVGYAVPARNLIVVFYSRTSASPGNLRAVLKHELCHIIVHEHIHMETPNDCIHSANGWREKEKHILYSNG